jgi:hypothetical protein
MTSSLDREIRQLLLQMDLLPAGSVCNYNASGGHGSDDGARVPRLYGDMPPEDRPLGVFWRERFADAEGPADLRRLLTMGRDELAAFKVHAGTGPGLMSDREILRSNILSSKGWPAADVARRWNCPERYVRRVRAEDGWEGETGQLAPTFTARDRQAQAVDLTENHGLSQAEAAERMGISQQRISQLLKTRRRDVVAV